MRKERAAKRLVQREATGRSVSTPAKKDKRRWCGGHVGREHVVVVGRKKALASWSIDRVPVIRYCRMCGKEFDYWSFALNRNRPTPSWVEQFLHEETRGA